jgi:cytochrome c553
VDSLRELLSTITTSAVSRTWRRWHHAAHAILVFAGCATFAASVGAIRPRDLRQEPGLAAQASATDQRTVWDGVYTEAQAGRGRSEYLRSCEGCHGSDLGGSSADEVPSLAFESFLTTWRGRTLKDLFARISRSMPHDSPGSLSQRAYIDVLSYILQANGFPTGTRQLETSLPELEQIVISRAPTSGSEK